MIRCVLISVALLAMAGHSVKAGMESLTASERKSAIFLETIAIPSASEFFDAVDKQCQPNWSQVPKTAVPANTTQREQLALQLGALMTDSYVAVEARDAQSVKNNARDLINLTKKLNIGQSIIARRQSISDFAEKNSWITLFEELDATKNDIRLALQAQKDHDLVVFLSTGAWIREMDVAANLAAANPKPSLCLLLVQPSLINHIIDRLTYLPEKTLNLPITQKILQGLESARALMQQAHGNPLGEASVKELAATMSSLAAIVAWEPANP